MNHPDKTNLDTPDIENVNVLDFEAMPSPEDIHARVPLSPQAKHTVMAGREPPAVLASVALERRFLC